MFAPSAPSARTVRTVAQPAEAGVHGPDWRPLLLVMASGILRGVGLAIGAALAVALGPVGLLLLAVAAADRAGPPAPGPGDDVKPGDRGEARDGARHR
jgi:hypothetical protein